MKKPKLILGSASPRRRKLLEPYYHISVTRPSVDEKEKKGENPKDYVRRVAKEKWLSLESSLPADKLLLTGDTAVALDGKIFGKAASHIEARRMLRQFSGKEHSVISAVCVGLTGSKPRMRTLSTQILFRKLLADEISFYLQSRKWQGKAGAYGIQDLGGMFVDRIRGSYTNVVGLPLKESLELIEQCRLQQETKV